MGDSFLKLVNPAFKFGWNGKEYEVKKASLEQVAQYQQRASEYVANNTPSSNQLLAAFAIYLVLKKVSPEITEQEVLENTQGDIDYIQLFTTLGFMNPARVQAALTSLAPHQTMPESGQPSQTAPDGLPTTSAG